MKKDFLATLALVIGMMYCLPELSAQTKPANCLGCKHAIPNEVFTSSKNAVTVSGPPDGKGDPVEFQIFSQAKTGGQWKFETSGVVGKPGTKETFKYYKPSQLMVVVYCGTPFGNMVEFSTVRMPAPSTDVIAPPPSKG